MILRRLRFTVALAATLIGTAPAFAAEMRHQLLEPIQPHRQHQEKVDDTPPAGKLCYCRTLHQRNAAGRMTWKVVCSEERPDHGARKIRADDCRAIRNLPPS